jgi:hypothetical protein
MKGRRGRIEVLKKSFEEKGNGKGNKRKNPGSWPQI